MMKRCLFLCLLIVSCCTLSAQTEMVRLTRFEGRAITGVRVASGIDVELIRDERARAVVEVESAYERNLLFTIDAAGVVNVGFKSPFVKRVSYCVVKVYTNTLHTIQLSGSSTMTATGMFNDPMEVRLSGRSSLMGLHVRTDGTMQLDCSGLSKMSDAVIVCRDLTAVVCGASVVRMDVEGNLTCDVSGASRMVASGDAGVATIRCAGASRFDGDALSADDVHIQAAAGSDVRVGTVRNDLKASGTSASNIVYAGNPSARDITVSSTSSVKHKL